jgi:hypothetical protein
MFTSYEMTEKKICYLLVLEYSGVWSTVVPCTELRTTTDVVLAQPLVRPSQPICSTVWYAMIDGIRKVTKVVTVLLALYNLHRSLQYNVHDVQCTPTS